MHQNNAVLPPRRALAASLAGAGAEDNDDVAQVELKTGFPTSQNDDLTSDHPKRAAVAPMVMAGGGAATGQSLPANTAMNSATPNLSSATMASQSAISAIGMPKVTGQDIVNQPLQSSANSLLATDSLQRGGYPAGSGFLGLMPAGAIGNSPKIADIDLPSYSLSEASGAPGKLAGLAARFSPEEDGKQARLTKFSAVESSSNWGETQGKRPAEYLSGNLKYSSPGAPAAGQGIPLGASSAGSFQVEKTEIAAAAKSWHLAGDQLSTNATKMAQLNPIVGIATEAAQVANMGHQLITQWLKNGGSVFSEVGDRLAKNAQSYAQLEQDSQTVAAAAADLDSAINPSGKYLTSRFGSESIC